MDAAIANSDRHYGIDMPPSHAHTTSTSAVPTMSSYAEWERDRNRARRAGNKSLSPLPANRPPTSSSASDAASTSRSPSAPPSVRTDTRGADSGPLARGVRRFLPTHSTTSAAQARFPTDLPARGAPGPQYTMSMGEVRRWDGRRACRVGPDGRCECGKIVAGQRRGVSPNARPGETEDERAMRRRREMWNMKGKGFWGIMSMSFAR